MPRRLFLAVCAIAFVPCFVACGDDDDADDGLGAAGDSPTAAGGAVSVSTAVPVVSGPAGKYSVSIEDIGLQWFTDLKATYETNSPEALRLYVERSKAFRTPADGMRLLRDWGFVEGYETAYIPEGRDQSVLSAGRYYINIETYILKDAEGAAEAYDYFVKTLTTAGASPIEITGIGNQAQGFLTVYGTFAGSSVNAAYHQVVFQRGNVVEIVLTKGARGFMKIDPAWELARIADQKLLGERTAIQPTPASNYKAPSAAATP